MINRIKHSLLLFAVAIIFLPMCVNAQPALYQMTHDFTMYDMKSYSVTEQTDNSGYTDNYLCKAGTIYNYSAVGKHVVHFVNMRYDGYILYSKVYDDAGYDEERAVSIVGNGTGGSPGNATYFIISQIRPFTGADDQIRIQQVDYTGTPTTSASYIQATGGPNQGSLYPLNAVYDPNTNLIFICGYWTAHNVSTQLPNSPGYSSSKRSFVLSFNPATKAVVNTALYNSVTSPAFTDDYDMAMRVDVEPGSGDIHVTGSINAIKDDGFGNPTLRSGVLNIVYNSSLNSPTAQPSVQKSFIEYILNDLIPDHEYGIGFVNTNGEKFIVGNKFYRNGGHSMGGVTTGFDCQPTRVWVNWINNATYDPGVNNSRWAFNDNYEYVWGLQALESNSSALLRGHVRIAGQQSYEHCNHLNTYAASGSNIVPFLMDVDMSYTGGSAASSSVPVWKVYENQTGTGNTANTNCYQNLGCNLDIMGWNCTPAITLSTSGSPTTVAFTAPKWNINGANTLNPKSLRVDWSTLNVATNCDPVSEVIAGPPACSTAFTDLPVTTTLDYGGNTVTPGWDVIPTSIGNNTVSDIDILGNQNDMDCANNGGLYKSTTGISSIVRQKETKIYPNPATYDINVALSKDIQDNATIQVVLINVYGQVVSKLYAGIAGGLTQSLQLPAVAKGLYTVEVTSNGRNVCKHKLAIQ